MALRTALLTRTDLHVVVGHVRRRLAGASRRHTAVRLLNEQRVVVVGVQHAVVQRTDHHGGARITRHRELLDTLPHRVEACRGDRQS